MSDYPARLEALKLAIEFAGERPMTAEGLIFTSTVIENYLAMGSRRTDGSGSVRIVFDAPDKDTGSGRGCGDAVNNIDGLTDDASDVSALGVESSLNVSIDGDAVTSSQGAGNVPDQSLTGHVVTHNSSSSVVADGESGDSVAADPRNDATPDTSEKGVRVDA